MLNGFADFLFADREPRLGRALLEKDLLHELVEDLLLDIERLDQPFRDGAPELFAVLGNDLVIGLLKLLIGNLPVVYRGDRGWVYRSVRTRRHSGFPRRRCDKIHRFRDFTNDRSR